MKVSGKEKVKKIAGKAVFLTGTRNTQPESPRKMAEMLSKIEDGKRDKTREPSLESVGSLFYSSSILMKV